MRRLLLLVLALLAAAPAAFSQSTTVSGTITDAGGQAWFSGTVQFTFRPASSNPTAQYFWNGAPFDKSTTIPQSPLPLDGTGSFAGVSVPSNNFITPSGSTWTVQVCPASTTSCFSQNLTITGATQNISAQIVPPAINLNLSVPLLGARAYTDSEVTGAQPGSSYFNNTDNRLHLCLLTGFPPCTWFVVNGGAGSVSSVSSGNFSPLFNVTVANPTTTPAFSFTALNAPAGTIFGNPTGAPAPASFNTPSSFSGIVTNVTASAPIASSGGTTPNITCASCVTSVTGTANQIASSGGTTPTLSIPATFIAPGTVKATTSLAIASSVAATGIQGTDTNLLSAGTFAGATGATVCKDALGGATTTGCATGGFTQIEAAISLAPCTPPSGSSFDACAFTLSWPHSFADTTYAVACSPLEPGANGGNASTNLANILYVATVNTGNISVIVQNARGAQNTPSAVFCIGVHP